MSRVLVTYNGNWADEMDISAIQIFDKADWDKVVAFAKTYTSDITVCIGTNEEVEFDNGKDWLKKMHVKPISDNDAEVIEKYIGDSFGFDNIIYRMSDLMSDAESEEE